MAYYVKKNGVVTPLSGLVQYDGYYHTFNVPTSAWGANPDSTTSTDYPYVATIQTTLYTNDSRPVWQMNGVGTIPTGTEIEDCNKVLEAKFSSTGIILYATDEPTVALVLEVSGGISVIGGGNSDIWTAPVACAIGDTDCTIQNLSILTTSIIEDWCENASGTKIAVPQITVTNGQAVLSFDALEEATSFRLHIINL